MNSTWLIGAEIAITFVVVVGFCLWQLRALNRLKRERDRRTAAKDERTP